MLKDIEAVIFDLDGTLVDSMGLWDDIDVAFLKKHNHQVPDDLEEIIAGMSFTEVAIYFKKRFDISTPAEEIKKEWVEMARYKYIHEAMLKPGARKLLEYLKDHNIKLGIASSNSRELVDDVLKARDIGGFFDEVHTSCEVASGKPSPDIYLLTAKHLAVSPSKCLVFEDIPMGITAGKDAGMKTCAVADEFSAHQEMQKRELADYYIDSFEQVLAETYEVCDG